MKFKVCLPFQKFSWKLVDFRVFLFVFLPFPQVLFAQNIKGPVWFRAYQTPVKEFDVHIKALAGSHINYAQYLLSQKRKQAQSFRLQDKLITAQEHYLSGEGPQAMEVFQQISQQALSADWDEKNRRIILYSFLRMAQSEEDLEKRKALLLSVSAFSTFKISPSSYSDYNLFPPPLMEELEQIQKNTNTLLVNWEKLFPHHEIILINGRQIQKGQKEVLPQAFYRISAFSSAYQPWTQNLNLSDLSSQTIKTKSLTKGPCGKEQIQLEKEDLCPSRETSHSRESGNPETSILPTKLAKNSRRLSGSRANGNLYTCGKEEVDFQVLSPVNCAKPAVLFNKNHREDPSSSIKADLALQKGLSTVSLEEFSEEKKEQPNTFSQFMPWIALGTGVIVFSLALSLSHGKKSQSNKQGDYVY